jgi:uncharacterized membrane protein
MMNSVLAAVLRLAIIMGGLVVLFVSKFEGWLAGIGVMILAIGAGWIIAASRDSAREAREREESSRFENVHFEDDDEPKGPWAS